jgi:thioredoxin 1
MNMANVAAVTSADFKEKVLNSDVPVLVDFWAQWCGPCRMIAPHVEAVAEQFAGKAKVYKVDVDQETELASQYGIMSIPTLMIFKGGKQVDQIVGAQPQKAIADRLERVIGNS